MNLRHLPLCDGCGKAVLVDGICPKCDGPLVEVEYTTDPAHADAPPRGCLKCDLLGRVFGDYAQAFIGAAAMLGFEAPEDVAPAMLLAQLRVSLQKRREAESKLKECAGLLAQNVEANKRSLEQFRRLADLLDRGDVELARAEVAEVLHG